MTMTGKTLAIFAATAALYSAHAETIYLKDGDESGKNSFENGTNFDGKVPSAGNDYVVALGLGGSLGVRTRETGSSYGNTEVIFGGDSLQIGTDDKAGTLLFKSIGTTTNSVKNLILKKGGISVGQGGGSTATAIALSSTSVLGGRITVTSPASAPFSFSGSYCRAVNITADISGAAGTGLAVGRHAFAGTQTEARTGDFAVYLNGDNAAYRGSWMVDGYSLTATQLAPLNGATVTLEIPNRAALGDDPDALVTDAITLRHGAILAVKASATAQTLNLGNRGLNLDIGGGVLKHAGKGRLTLKGTVSGSNNLTVETAGEFAFAGKWKASGKLIVTDQTLFLTDGADIALDQIQLNGTATVVFEAGTGDPEPLTQWPLPEGEKMRVTVPAFAAYDVGPTELTIVKVPTSVKVVTAADFEPVYAGALGTSAELAQLKVEVETTDGLQVVRVTRPTYVTLTDKTVGSGGNTDVSPNLLWDTTTAWSNGVVAQPGFDYLIYQAHALRTPNIASATFPGRSLTIVGSEAARSELALKAQETTVDRLCLGDCTYLSAKAYSGNSKQTLSGSLVVNSTDDKGVCLRSSSGKSGVGTVTYPDADVRVFEVAAEISGDAKLRVLPYDNHVAHVKLTGLNTNFVGSVVVEPYGTTSDSTLVLTDGRNLGGNPLSFLEKGLFLKYGHLYAEENVVLDQVNRGLFLESNAYLEVPEGKTLEIAAPVSYNGVWVRKDGPGLLKLAGETRKGADNTRFYVRNGALQQSNLSAFKNLKTLCVHPSAKLVVPYQTGNDYGLLFTGIGEEPLVIGGNGTKLNVAVALPDEEVELPRHFIVPLLTVRKGCTTTTVSDQNPVGVTSAAQIALAPRPGRRYTAKLVSDEVEIEGVAYTRYSAECQICGLVLIIK